MKYKIIDKTPTEGDWVINTSNKNNTPKIVERAENSTSDNVILGVRLNGWFDWMPITKHHKVVILNHVKDSEL